MEEKCKLPRYSEDAKLTVSAGSAKRLPQCIAIIKQNKRDVMTRKELCGK